MNLEIYMHNFSIIHRYSVMHHLKDMRDCPVSGHQMGYIIFIKKNPGVSQEDIAEFFKLNKGTVAKGVKRLLKDGYIIRTQNESDRRAYCLYLTEKGEVLFSESEKSLQRLNAIFTNGMSQEEQQTLQRLIIKVADNVLEASGEARDELIRPIPPNMEHPSCSSR